jgi:hypothetical protein
MIKIIAVEVSTQKGIPSCVDLESTGKFPLPLLRGRRYTTKSHVP